MKEWIRELPLERQAHAAIGRVLEAKEPVPLSLPNFWTWAAAWASGEDRSFASATAMHTQCAELLETARLMEAASLAACRAASARRVVSGEAK